MARKYTPISRADLKRNSFELLIKVYFKQPPQWPNGGLMSQHVNGMQLGESIKATLPFGRFNYLGKSQVQIKELYAIAYIGTAQSGGKRWTTSTWSAEEPESRRSTKSSNM